MVAIGVGGYIMSDTFLDLMDGYSKGISNREAPRLLIDIVLAGYVLYIGKEGLNEGLRQIDHIQKLEHYLGRSLKRDDFHQVHPQ